MVDNFVHKILRRTWENQKIDILRDQYGNPTSVSEWLNMMKRILQIEVYGINHAVCDGKTSRFAFAAQIIREAGLSVPVREIGRKGETVFDTSLLTEKLQRVIRYQSVHWTKTLRSYLTEVKNEDYTKPH